MRFLGVSCERLFKFQLVGVLGAVVQIGLLAVLIHQFGIDYRISTAIAVEVAVIHNFLWHERWTWRNRIAESEGAGPRFRRFCRFNTTNGIFSILLNVAMTHVYVEIAGAPHLVANILAIATGSFVTFFLADLLVFPPAPADPA